MPMYSDFEVRTVTDLIDRFSLVELISDVSRPPDHSIVISSVHLSPGDTLCDVEEGHTNVGQVTGPNEMVTSSIITDQNINTIGVNQGLDKSRRKYDMSTINTHDNFMSNVDWRDKINVIIDDLQTACSDQREVDSHYDDMCKVIFSEMDKFLNYKEFSGQKSGRRLKFHKPSWNDHLTLLWKAMCSNERSFLKIKGHSKEKVIRRDEFVRARSKFDKYLRSCQKSGRRLKFHKPYWNDHLTLLWKAMCCNERSFLKIKGHSKEKVIRRDECVRARSKFDKYLRSCQREYRKRKINDIEYACKDDPRKFWDHIKRLGPKKKPCIQEVVRTTDGLSTDTNVILEEWRNTFDKLYNPKVGSHDKLFYDNALKYLSEYDTNTPPDNNLENDIINSVITFDETVKVIRKLKLKKAVGVDFIPKMRLSNLPVYIILYTSCLPQCLIRAWCHLRGSELLLIQYLRGLVKIHMSL